MNIALYWCDSGSKERSLSAIWLGDMVAVNCAFVYLKGLGFCSLVRMPDDIWRNQDSQFIIKLV